MSKDIDISIDGADLVVIAIIVCFSVIIITSLIAGAIIESNKQCSCLVEEQP